MTTLVQVCGRLRDSDYNDEIYQFYATSPYKDVTMEEFKAAQESEFQEAIMFAKAMDTAATGYLREDLIEKFVNKYKYLGVVEGKIVADRNFLNREMMNYGIVNGQYATQYNMTTSLTNAGFNVIQGQKSDIPNEALEELKSISKTSFKDIFEEYVSLRESKGYNLNCFRQSRIEVEKPLVKEAYETLGADKVREMKYHQSNLKNELIKRKHETLDTKVFLLIDPKLPKGVPILRTEIKTIISDAYAYLGEKRTAKATDLNR